MGWVHVVQGQGGILTVLASYAAGGREPQFLAWSSFQRTAWAPTRRGFPQSKRAKREHESTLGAAKPLLTRLGNHRWNVFCDVPGHAGPLAVSSAGGAAPRLEDQHYESLGPTLALGFHIFLLPRGCPYLQPR